MKHLLIYCTLLMSLLALQGQDLPYQRYVPRSLDSLSHDSIRTMQVWLNDLSAGGEATEKGLAVASFKWDEQYRIQSAVNLQISSGQIRGKDSLAWQYRADSVFSISYELAPADQDYADYAPFIDYGNLADMDLPPFSQAYLVQADTFILRDGQVVHRRDGFSQVQFQYNEQGLLQAQETIIPERVAMGMGGITLETYTYDDAGKLMSKAYIQAGPNGLQDTSVHVFQYNPAGQLVMEIEPSPSVPGVSSIQQYDYEAGQLVRETKQRSTFRSSGPPHYHREEITLHFETTYRYHEGQLVEERLMRDGEPESNGWIQYTYNSQGLLQQKTIMNVHQHVPSLIFTYEYSF